MLASGNSKSSARTQEHEDAARGDANQDKLPLDPPSQESGAETLAQSVAMLALMTVMGKGVGFVRSLLFCRWLPETELGLWDLANGFLMLAAPLAVLGLTGSFRRYLEHFRTRGQARTFLKRVAWVTTLTGSLAITGLILARDAFSQFVFDTSSAGQLVLYTALALGPLLVFFFVFEFFAGLRMFRKVTVLQFIQTLAFAIIGCIALASVEATANAVMLSYAAATVICAGVAVIWASRAWSRLPEHAVDQGPSKLSQGQMWSKIVPFAMWIWVTNWLANLFEVIDRYMLVHFSRMDEATALAAVGNYHSARVAPLLLVSVAAMLNSAVLPHLTADWEAGRKAAVSARLGLTLKLLSLVLLGGALFILVAAPWLFDYGFGGKFAGGQDILPLALVYMIWSGLATVFTTYLWCAERAKLGSLALAIGLILNIGLNLLLVPSLGLRGAVIATCAANAAGLALTHYFSAKLDFTGGRALIVLFAAPLALLLGPLPSAAVLVALAHQATTRNWLLTPNDRERLNEVLSTGLARMRRIFQRKHSAAR